MGDLKIVDGILKADLFFSKVTIEKKSFTLKRWYSFFYQFLRMLCLVSLVALAPKILRDKFNF